MSNQYPGYCVDCDRQVKAGHGDLKKRNGKYVVSCGRASQRASAQPKPPAPKPERPTGMRITDPQISSSNASLCVKFGINGVGHVRALAPYASGTATKYASYGAWSPDLAQYSKLTPDEHRLRWETDAAKHLVLVKANEALYNALKAQGQIAFDSKDEFSLYLSEDEQQALSTLIMNTKAQLLAAILDGTAAIEIHTVGCDYPHPQVSSITLPGQDKPVEWALMYDLLVHDLHLKIDGTKECDDLAGAIRDRQAKLAEADAAREQHRQRRAAGYHVVALRRCWECGQTQILGEYNDVFGIERMPESVYRECVAEQKAAHARSLATVPEGTILSSVGFAPAPESKFDFRIEESDWYCGC